MKKELFDDLMAALNDAARFERGGKLSLRTVAIPPPPRPMSPRQIRALRRRMRVSQAVFGCAMNVSTETVQSWEQGVRKPGGAALKLLRLAAADPRILAKTSAA